MGVNRLRLKYVINKQYNEKEGVSKPSYSKKITKP